MSMPPPKPGPSKNHDHEDGELQGRNEEKKGRAVQAQVPQAPRVPVGPLLTWWHPYARPMSNKLKAVQAAQNALKALQQQEGNHDLREAKSAVSKAQMLPEDLGSNVAVLRTQLGPFIASLVRDQCYQFSQGQQRHVARIMLKWNVGGLCAAFCMEYIHWRRYTVSPAEIIKLFKSDATQDWMGHTQANFYEGWTRLENFEKSRASYPERDRLFSAVLAADSKRNRHEMFVAPFNNLHDRLVQGYGYPLSITKKRLVLVGDIARFNFSLQTLEALRPPGRASIPIMHRFAFYKSRPASLHDASSSSISSSSSSPALAQFHLSTSNAAAEPLSESVEIQLVKWEFNKFETDFQVLRHLILTNLEEPYVLIGIDRANEAKSVMGTAGATSGHAIVLDLSRGRAGIFDPNFGFLPLGSSVDSVVDKHELYWLLGLLLVLYDAYRIRLYALR